MWSWLWSSYCGRWKTATVGWKKYHLKLILDYGGFIIPPDFENGSRSADILPHGLGPPHRAAHCVCLEPPFHTHTPSPPSFIWKSVRQRRVQKCLVIWWGCEPMSWFSQLLKWCLWSQPACCESIRWLCCCSLRVRVCVNSKQSHRWELLMGVRSCSERDSSWLWCRSTGERPEEAEAGPPDPSDGSNTRQ